MQQKNITSWIEYFRSMGNKYLSKIGKEITIDKEFKPVLIDVIKYLNFCSDLDHSKGILFYGNIGSGKSLMMKLIQLNLNAKYRKNWGDSLQFIIQNAMSLQEDFLKNNCLSPVYDRSILGIDDLGSESSYIQNYGNYYKPLELILDQRYNLFMNTGIKTFGTTNLAYEGEVELLKDYYSKRIYSRMKQLFNFIKFTSPFDRRET